MDRGHGVKEKEREEEARTSKSVVSRLQLCSGAEAVRKLERAGWSAVRRKGSHVMMTRKEYRWTLAIPQHRELGPGLLRRLLKQADISVEDFNAL